MNQQNEAFDPYYIWLAIPPEDQPANHYRLLGLSDFEANDNVIDAAANRILSYLQQCTTGEHVAEAQALMNEISAVRLCLLNKEQKAAYDEELKETFPEAEIASDPEPPPPPLLPEIITEEPATAKTSSRNRQEAEKEKSKAETSSRPRKKTNDLSLAIYLGGGLLAITALVLFFMMRSPDKPVNKKNDQKLAQNDPQKDDVDWGRVDPPGLSFQNLPDQNENSSQKIPAPISGNYQPLEGTDPDDWQGTKAGEVRTIESLGANVCWCPPGTFTMGSPKDETGRDDDEDQVEVTLTKGFWMGQTEVTQRQYEIIMDETPWSGRQNTMEGPNYPAGSIDYHEANEFCETLTERERRAGRLPEGWAYQLPTEAQWEYACRAGTTAAWHFGNDVSNLGDYAWYKDNAWAVGEHYAHEVGKKKPNAWNMYDMYGNVWEWCLDWYDSDLPGGTDPIVKKEPSSQVFRGGRWDDSAKRCRSAFRRLSSPMYRYQSLGFRFVIVPVISKETSSATSPALVKHKPLTGTDSEDFQGTKAGEVRTIESLGVNVCWCPAGTFTMGSPKGEKDRDNDEDQVEVTLTKGFWMMQTEVTQGLWEEVMSTTPWKGKSDVKEGANYAASYVSHDDVMKFCEELTKRGHEEGWLPKDRKVTLPTEAQWEYACRAGTTTTYHFGNEASKLGNYAWYDENAYDVDEKYAHEVGKKKPNRFGLFDTHGGVWEWCLDDYGSILHGGTDPIRSAEKESYRILRGGGWQTVNSYCRAAHRRGASYRLTNESIGFRFVIVPGSTPGSGSGSTSNGTLTARDLINRIPVDSFAGKKIKEGKRLGIKRTLVKWCPPGSFTMGSPSNENSRRSDEDQVKVSFSRGFWMSQYEVTQELFGSVAGISDPWRGEEYIKRGDDFPAANISYVDAKKFCERYTIKGHNEGWLPKTWIVSLPTEAQWEYAARAGSEKRYSFGSDSNDLHKYGWYLKNTAEVDQKYPHEVGKKLPNKWGIYDMHGNVGELCLNKYRYNHSERVKYSTISEIENPLLLPEKSYDHIVVRGGAWNEGYDNCRPAIRGHIGQRDRHFFIGFRFVLVPRSFNKPDPVVVRKPKPLAGKKNYDLLGAYASEVRTIESLGMNVCWCPRGSFTMGSPQEESGHESNEKQVSVYLSHGFWMGQYEVTQEQWEKVMKTTPWGTFSSAGRDKQGPATYLRHHAGIEFCEKLTKQGHEEGWLPDDWEISLPTEAEWEYACRSGSRTTFWFGDDPEEFTNYGWCRYNTYEMDESYVHKVGLKRPNYFGLYDVHGNVAELCLDYYHSELPGGRNPLSTENADSRVLRGGSFSYAPRDCRSAERWSQSTTTYYSGMRIAVVYRR